MAEIADLSDDENFASYRGNFFAGCAGAHNFFMMLRGQTSGSRHVDSVADALMRWRRWRRVQKIQMRMWRQPQKPEDDTMNLLRIRRQNWIYGRFFTTESSLMRKVEIQRKECSVSQTCWQRAAGLRRHCFLFQSRKRQA
eukprot:s3521_g11.t1